MASSSRSFHDFERAGWEDSDVSAKYHEHLSGVTTQSVGAILDAAEVGRGSRVLDVATGAGYIAAAAKKRGADAIGVDFSQAQIRAARERYPDIRFEQGDAEALPFDAEAFDAVVNGFGMCHLANPDAALRDACRVLRHGGRVAFTVWDAPERAVAFGALYAAIRAHGSLDVGLPVGPNFFLFSDAEHSKTALTNAGFVSPSYRQLAQTWRVSEPDSVFEVLSEATVRAAATLRGQTPQAKEAIRAALRKTISLYKAGAYYEIPAPAILAAAVKP